MNSSPQQSQLLLPGFGLRNSADFSSYFAGTSNALAKQAVEKLTQQAGYIYLSGGLATGKSHLLQAACHQVVKQGGMSVYLPLSELLNYPPSSVLEGIEDTDLIAIDELHLLVGHSEWQLALFNLYNYRFDYKLSLLFAADKPAALLPLELADLQSRLTACTAFQLQALSDEEKLQMLVELSEQRGMVMNEQCAVYILQHYGRSNSDLIAILDVLAEATLLEKRKITVPFIKQQLLEAKL